MKRESFAWNQTLRFSWAHIITFVAVIIISFMTFSGMTYLTAGDFLKSGIVTAAVDIILLPVFIGAQLAKAAERKFARKIWVERILVFTSPVVFLLLSYPMSHFFSVHNDDAEIVDSFVEALNSSKQIFTDYEDYAQTRIENYESMLNKVLESQDGTIMEQYGFTPEYPVAQKNNMVDALKLQLISENYDKLRDASYQWIDESNVGATTWNAFLIGNVKDIKSAVNEWVKVLETDFSSHKMFNEELDGNNEVESFKETSLGYEKFEELLDKVTDSFTKKQFPNALFFLIAILLYGAMILPYIIQSRNTKNSLTLLGNKGHHSVSSGRNKGEDYSTHHKKESSTFSNSTTSSASGQGGYGEF